MTDKPLKATTAVASLGGVAGMLTIPQGREILTETAKSITEAVESIGAHGGLGLAGLAATSHGRELIAEDLKRVGVKLAASHELQMPEGKPSNSPRKER